MLNIERDVAIPTLFSQLPSRPVRKDAAPIWRPDACLIPKHPSGPYHRDPQAQVSYAPVHERSEKIEQLLKRAVW